MISINKYGQNVNLSKVVEVNGKKTFSLDGIDLNKTLIIKVPKDVKFVSTLVEEDLKIEFKDKDGNIFELILKNMTNLLAQNDGDKLIEILRENTNETLASITDLTSALEAAAAGAGGAENNANSDNARNSQFQDLELELQDTTYDNDRVDVPLSSNGEIPPFNVVFGANNAPLVTVSADAIVNEDESILIPFSATDLNNDTLTPNVTATNGIVTINANVITYTPNENFNGSDVITLTVNDGTTTTTQTINVTVNPVNDAPIIEVNSILTVDEDGTQTITFISNDIDADTLTPNVTATNGIVTINANVITYTPNENFNGSDVITLTVNDGTTTTTQTINVTVNPVNDAPIASAVYTQTQNDNSIKEYTGQLKATDVDVNDTLTYSVDSSSVNVSLTISNLNGLSTLVALNNPIVESVLLSLKPVITNFINTGDLSGFLTLNPQTIMTTKAIVGTLQEFLNVNSDLKDSIVLLKDFIIANKDEIIANTNLVAQDIVILQSLLTQENLIALENLYHSVNSFLDANPQIKELATTILADNIISPLELVTLNPILLAQIEGLRVQLKSIVDSNSTVLDLISINEVIAKLQEVVTVDAVNQEVSIKTTVPETLANMIVTLDENTGEYTINNAFAEKFSSLGDLEISFDYKVIDSEGAESNISSASILIKSNSTLTGTSIDGYISGMKVFSDTNANNLSDEEEANTLTNEVGEFTLTGTLTGITIGEGGVDISTNVEFEGQYKAPSGVSVLNPITTLIVNLVNEGVSQEEAETLIYQSLGLDSNISLFDDPIENSINASTQEETSNYISLQVVNVMIENTVSQIAATISAGNISDEKTAYIMASKELAKLLLSDETIDLVNSNDLRTIIENTLTSLEYTITSEDSTVVSNLVEIIMNINNSMKESTTEFLNAQEALTNLAKIQIVSEEIENDIEINISEEDGDLSIIKEINSVESIMVASEDVEVGFITKEQALNHAPIINVEPIIELSETDLSSTTTLPDVYYVISEEEMFEMLDVTDVDVNDGLSISLVSNSSVFASTNTGIINGVNGVVQLTQERIDTLGINAKVGDFFVFSNGFDGLGEDEIVNVSFEVVATDGKDNSATSKVNLVINGVNDAPIINVEPIIELSETDLSSTTTLPDVYYVISEEEMFEMLDVTDVDVNDGLSISLVSNSSVFASTNTGIINGVNGVVQLTQERIDTLGINAKVGDFFVFSNGFDGLGEDEIVNVSFEVVATDGKDNSATSKVNLVINGVNDAPIINVEPIIELSETDLSSTTTLPDVYYVISEEEMFEMLDVTDVDVNDGLSISLVSNSSVFASTNTGIINGVNGVVQLTQERIDTLGINAKVGDFFVFSNGFDGLGEDEIVNVSFEVVATDGKDNSATSKVNLVINGVNDAPITIDVSTQTQNDNSIKEYTGQLKATDVDLNDTLTYSVDSSSVNVSLTISNLNGLSTLVALNNPVVESVLLSLKPVITNFINTGDLSGFLTLNPQTIMTTKAIVGTLQEFLNVNSDLKDSIVLLKDFIIANKDEIIANTNLVAQDIVILQSLLTQENLIALENLYHSVNSFLDANPQIKELATTILADNIISPLELVTLNPILLAQIEGLRVQLKSIVDSNSTVLDLISINEVIAKLQEVVTVDAVNQEVSIKTTVPETLANMIVTLDENTGEYTINNAFAEKFSSLGDLEISFDYKVIDSEGAESNISSASILITTEDVEEMTTSLDKEGSISFDNENIDLATILDNISSNIEIEDIDSIDLSNAEHILSNLTIEDFEAMVSDDSSNTLAINGENNDVIKLDLSIWSKEESDKDNNSEVENEDDGYIAYTATGTTEQTLTLLIDKDITVENI